MNAFEVAARINADTLRLATALNLAESKLEEALERPFGDITHIPEKEFSEEEVYAGYAGFRYSIVVAEHNPLLKTIEVRVVYSDAAGNAKEVNLSVDRARR